MGALTMGTAPACRVLLVIEPPEDERMCFHHLVPIGPLGIVSFLESKGVRADIADLNVEPNLPDPTGYDAVGFSVTNANIGTTRERIRSLRETVPGLRIFVGGPEALAHPLHLFNHLQPDAVVVGEAEPTIYRYLTTNDAGRVPGLVVRDSEGSAKPTGEARWVQSLDALPFPALDRVDLSLYDSPLRRRRPISVIMTSRGCPWRCTFCYHSHGTQWRARSAQNVVEEIAWQANELGVGEIAIYDDTFTVNRGRASKICRGIRERDIDVLLQARTRPDCIDRNLLEDMRAAGLWLMGFGFESGNQETVDRVQKGLSLEAGKQAVRWCRELGITTRAFFILGFPWEGEAEVENTIRFAREVDADITQFTRLILFPGTPLYDEFSPESKGYWNQGFFCGARPRIGSLQHLEEGFLQRSITRAYRSTNMRPRNLLRLMRSLPLSTFIHTTRFAWVTRNL